MSAITWIPVTDRLPGTDGIVLVWFDADVWDAAWWSADVSQWIACESGGRLEGVTHWADVEGPTC
jgi:hypothetical protein